MKKLFQISAVLAFTFIMAGWSYTDTNKAVFMPVDSEGKVHRIESGEVDKSIFDKGVKSFSIVDKHKKLEVTYFKFTFVPKANHPKTMIHDAKYPNTDRLNNYVSEEFQDLEGIEKVIVDEIYCLDGEGNKVVLAPIVIRFK